MRAAMAYFAGAGTVIAAIGIGLGGGLTIANVLSPHQEKQEYEDKRRRGDHGKRRERTPGSD